MTDDVELTLDQTFNVLFDAAIGGLVQESGHQVADWMRSGVMKPEAAIERWRELGPKVCQNFFDWYETSEYRVWVAPDGRPGVELELEVDFGGVPVKAYIDAILYNDEHLLVLDTKSGAVVPDSYQQVGFYASCIELAYGIRPLMGAFFMARGAGRNKDIFLTEPRPLNGPELSIEFFAEQLIAMEKGRAANAFTANVTKNCERCDVAMYCAAVGGEFSRLVDPSHPDFVPWEA